MDQIIGEQYTEKMRAVGESEKRNVVTVITLYLGLSTLPSILAMWTRLSRGNPYEAVSLGPISQFLPEHELFVSGTG